MAKELKFLVSIMELGQPCLSSQLLQPPLINPVRFLILGANVGQHGVHVLANFKDSGTFRRVVAVSHVRRIHAARPEGRSFYGRLPTL